MFLKISQSSREKTCARVFFIKVVGNFIKKQTLAQVFSCEFSEILRTPFLQNTYWGLIHCILKVLQWSKYLTQLMTHVIFTLWAPTPQNGQTHSNNSSASADK